MYSQAFGYGYGLSHSRLPPTGAGLSSTKDKDKDNNNNKSQTTTTTTKGVNDPTTLISSSGSGNNKGKERSHSRSISLTTGGTFGGGGGGISGVGVGGGSGSGSGFSSKTLTNSMMNKNQNQQQQPLRPRPNIVRLDDDDDDDDNNANNNNDPTTKGNNTGGGGGGGRSKGNGEESPVKMSLIEALKADNLGSFGPTTHSNESIAAGGAGGLGAPASPGSGSGYESLQSPTLRQGNLVGVGASSTGQYQHQQYQQPASESTGVYSVSGKLPISKYNSQPSITTTVASALTPKGFVTSGTNIATSSVPTSTSLTKGTLKKQPSGLFMAAAAIGSGGGVGLGGGLIGMGKGKSKGRDFLAAGMGIGGGGNKGGGAGSGSGAGAPVIGEAGAGLGINLGTTSASVSVVSTGGSGSGGGGGNKKDYRVGNFTGMIEVNTVSVVQQVSYLSPQSAASTPLSPPPNSVSRQQQPSSTFSSPSSSSRPGLPGPIPSMASTTSGSFSGSEWGTPPQQNSRLRKGPPTQQSVEGSIGDHGGSIYSQDNSSGGSGGLPLPTHTERDDTPTGNRTATVGSGRSRDRIAAVKERDFASSSIPRSTPSTPTLQGSPLNPVIDPLESSPENPRKGSAGSILPSRPQTARQQSSTGNNKKGKTPSISMSTGGPVSASLPSSPRLVGTALGMDATGYLPSFSNSRSNAVPSNAEFAAAASGGSSIRTPGSSAPQSLNPSPLRSGGPSANLPHVPLPPPSSIGGSSNKSPTSSNYGSSSLAPISNQRTLMPAASSTSFGSALEPWRWGTTTTAGSVAETGSSRTKKTDETNLMRLTFRLLPRDRFMSVRVPDHWRGARVKKYVMWKFGIYPEWDENDTEDDDATTDADEDPLRSLGLTTGSGGLVKVGVDNNGQAEQSSDQLEKTGSLSGGPEEDDMMMSVPASNSEAAQSKSSIATGETGLSTADEDNEIGGDYEEEGSFTEADEGEDGSDTDLDIEDGAGEDWFEGGAGNFEGPTTRELNVGLGSESPLVTQGSGGPELEPGIVISTGSKVDSSRRSKEQRDSSESRRRQRHETVRAATSTPIAQIQAAARRQASATAESESLAGSERSKKARKAPSMEEGFNGWQQGTLSSLSPPSSPPASPRPRSPASSFSRSGSFLPRPSTSNSLRSERSTEPDTPTRFAFDPAEGIDERLGRTTTIDSMRQSEDGESLMSYDSSSQLHEATGTGEAVSDDVHSGSAASFMTSTAPPPIPIPFSLIPASETSLDKYVSEKGKSKSSKSLIINASVTTTTTTSVEMTLGGGDSTASSILAAGEKTPSGPASKLAMKGSVRKVANSNRRSSALGTEALMGGSGASVYEVERDGKRKKDKKQKGQYRPPLPFRKSFLTTQEKEWILNGMHVTSACRSHFLDPKSRIRSSAVSNDLFTLHLHGTSAQIPLAYYFCRLAKMAIWFLKSQTQKASFVVGGRSNLNDPTNSKKSNWIKCFMTIAGDFMDIFTVDKGAVEKVSSHALPPVSVREYSIESFPTVGSGAAADAATLVLLLRFKDQSAVVIRAETQDDHRDLMRLVGPRNNRYLEEGDDYNWRIAAINAAIKSNQIWWESWLVQAPRKNRIANLPKFIKPWRPPPPRSANPVMTHHFDSDPVLPSSFSKYPDPEDGREEDTEPEDEGDRMDSFITAKTAPSKTNSGESAGMRKAPSSTSPSLLSVNTPGGGRPRSATTSSLISSPGDRRASLPSGDSSPPLATTTRQPSRPSKHKPDISVFIPPHRTSSAAPTPTEGKELPTTSRAPLDATSALHSQEGDAAPRRKGQTVNSNVMKRPQA